jgi:hypothetical protein
MFILKSCSSHYAKPWSQDDYVVLNDGRQVIGRIMLHPQTPKDRPWFWTITALEYPPTIHSRGYSATPEEAMTAFKAQWFGC